MDGGGGVQISFSRKLPITLFLESELWSDKQTDRQTNRDYNFIYIDDDIVTYYITFFGKIDLFYFVLIDWVKYLSKKMFIFFLFW